MLHFLQEIHQRLDFIFFQLIDNESLRKTSIRFAPNRRLATMVSQHDF